VPFTCSYLPGKSNVQFVFWGFVLALIPATFGAQYELQALGASLRYFSIIFVLASCVFGLWSFNHRRAKSAILYYEELAPEVITTLGLKPSRS